MRKALFLDRDGIINIDIGYAYKAEDIIFVNGIFKVVRKANLMNYLVIVVTNQSGIGRHKYTIKQFKDLSNWMRNEFKIREAIIDNIYFSPYHPIHGVGKYKKDSFCRKPKPGMLLRAKREYNIDIEGSIMIGDKISDMEAAKNAGIKKLFLYNNNLDYDKAKKIKNLYEIIRYL
tara:strand:+ start:8985 stop:9509 length:525 start_codon:yes stop_codon:yes gene_type:complete